jgi:hypothetical protein
MPSTWYTYDARRGPLPSATAPAHVKAMGRVHVVDAPYSGTFELYLDQAGVVWAQHAEGEEDMAGRGERWSAARHSLRTVEEKLRGLHETVIELHTHPDKDTSAGARATIAIAANHVRAAHAEVLRAWSVLEHTAPSTQSTKPHEPVDPT